MFDTFLRVISRTTNPPVTPNGEQTFPAYDKLGRALMVPYQIREMTATAVASIATGTKTSFLAGAAGTYHDLVYVSFGNSSDVAATIELLDESTVVRTAVVPARSYVSFSFPVPIPQNTAGTNWYVDMEDITGTTIYVDAIFVKNL